MNRSPGPLRRNLAFSRAESTYWRPLLIVMVVLVGLLVAAAWVAASSGNASISRTPSDPVVTGEPVIGALLTPTPPLLPTPTSAFARASADPENLSWNESDCDPICLVRVAYSGSGTEFFDELGIRSGYVHDGVAWFGLPEAHVIDLLASGTSVHVVPQVRNPLSLYVVRLPEWEHELTLNGVAEILDKSGRQYLMAFGGEPPYVRHLTERSIAIEKLPPLIPPLDRGTDAMTRIDDPWTLASEVSKNQIEQRIRDLQSIGSERGKAGSREYTTAGNVEAADYLHRRLAGFGLRVWYEGFLSDDGRLLLNVVAEIPGTDQNTPVLLSAHFDSRAEDIGEPFPAPGALDNGTGVAVLLEIARVLKGYAIQHPVHVVFLNAEEYGLQGATAFGKRAVIDEERTYRAGINIDSIGAALPQNQIYLNYNDANRWISEMVTEVNRKWGLAVSVASSGNEKIVADHTELNRMGIPTIMAASVLYGDPLINNSTDMIDSVNLGYAQEVARLFLLATIELVTQPDSS
ncbi:hypothetical protein BH23CHL5_BH23CHL5_19280 [soil metagenome]